MKEITIIDTRRDKTYTFNCERWFSLFKEDCQISREINAISGKFAKKIDYEITTVTGKLIFYQKFVFQFYNLSTCYKK